MFRWLVVPIMFVALAGLVINEINRATAPKAQAYQTPDFPEKTPPVPVAEKVNILVVKADGPIITPTGRPISLQPLVIPNARISAVERQEIPSEKEGKLLFVGSDIKPVRDVPAKDNFQLRVGYLLVEMEKGEQSPNVTPITIPTKPGKMYRRWKESDPIIAGKIMLDYENKTFFKLEVGDDLTEGQLVGLVNPILALDDLSIRAAKLDASEADRRASEKTRDEAHKRFQQQALLRQKGAGSEEDYRSAELFWRRYIEEELGKAALVVQSQRELNAAVTTLKMHEIRSTIPGVIKAIYKNRGEAIKNLEPVLQVQNRNRLRVEGLMEIQDARAITRDSKVIVEPSQPEQPRMVLRGHLLDVTCVSVCKDEFNMVLSGSEDQSVRGWNANSGEQLWLMPFKSHVKSIGNNQGKNAICAVGLADGSLAFFRPHQIKESVKESQGRHRGTVHSVLVSPDGELAISCGEDRGICVWKTSNGELIQRLESDHKSAITSLAWAGPNQFISSGRDNAMYVWPLENGKILPHVMSFDRRSGDVTHLGASPNGKHILFDQGKEIRVLNLADKQLEGIIQSQTGSSNFSNFAIFSPDSATVLTNGGNDGKIQLWRSPVNNRRPAELRQLIWTTGSATCGAFSPDASFAVTGTQDHQVLIWNMPDKLEVEKTLIGTVRLVEPFLDSNSRQIRIWADMENPGWIHPGGTATLVIPALTAGIPAPNK